MSQLNTKLKALLRSIGFIAMYLFFGALLSQLKFLFPSQFERYAQGILGTIGVLLTVIVFLKFEKKKPKDYGLSWEKSSFAKFGAGLSLGIVFATAMMLSQVWYSNLELSLNDHISLFPFLFWSMAFIPLAFMEEVAFRSYPLLTLNKAFGFRTTQIILAILFAVYHMLMMWSPKASLLGPGIWAFAYALTALWSGGIAVPTGLHFGLNFVQSIIGGQKGIEPIWTLDYPANVSESSILANEQFGIGLHFFLLILCVVATEIYIRKRKTSHNN
ncbi:hypothetical protein GCM10027284_43420 [Cyclobacterium sediminis]